MLRCRPTRIVLKQEDVQEYESNRAVWIAEKSSQDKAIDKSRIHQHDTSDSNAGTDKRKQKMLDRLGMKGNA